MPSSSTVLNIGLWGVPFRGELPAAPDGYAYFVLNDGRYVQLNDERYVLVLKN